MIWIHVSLWSWLLVSSCSARPQGDKDVISHYLWLAKWRSPSSACPFCQPVMAPINQAQSCHWQESSSRTTSPWCTSTPSYVYLWHAGMGATKPPWHNDPATFPLRAQTVGGKPVFVYGGTHFSSETLFHSHAATTLKFAIPSLHGESLPQLNPGYCDLKGELLSIELIVWVCYVWFCFKPAITPNSTVQEVSDMVKLWCYIWNITLTRCIKYVCCCTFTLYSTLRWLWSSV